MLAIGLHAAAAHAEERGALAAAAAGLGGHGSLEAVLLDQLAAVGGLVDDDRELQAIAGLAVDDLDARLAPARASRVIVRPQVVDRHDVDEAALLGHLPPHDGLRRNATAGSMYSRRYSRLNASMSLIFGGSVVAGA